MMILLIAVVFAIIPMLVFLATAYLYYKAQVLFEDESGDSDYAFRQMNPSFPASRS